MDNEIGALESAASEQEKIDQENAAIVLASTQVVG